MAKLKDVVFDCRHAASLARFWEAALESYTIRPYDDDEIERLAGLGLTPETDPTVALDGTGPTLFFQEVSESKTVKNRLHLDLATHDRASEVERLLGLGAAVLTVYEDHTILTDPEGNEFCICDR